MVPTALRRTVLDSIHDGHFGIVKCLERAKNSVYWPGYIHDIQDKVASCRRCQEGRNENPRLPYEPHPVPFYPYQKVGMDLFELDGKTYLMSVDYYSKWITIINLDHTKSRDVIEAVDEQFANFGIPEEVISNNGPQFACTDFRSFADGLGFRHVTSSPGYPSSNGQAERSIQTAKKTMSKMFADGRSQSTKVHPNWRWSTVTSRTSAEQTTTHPAGRRPKRSGASSMETTRSPRKTWKTARKPCFP